MRWAGNVTRMVNVRNAYIIVVGKPEGKKRPLGRLDVDGRIILDSTLGQ
jgi:hypothetical protein